MSHDDDNPESLASPETASEQQAVADEKRRWPSTVLVALVLGLALVGLGLVTGSGESAGEDSVLEASTLPVVVITAQEQPGYRVSRSFVGRVEAHRESRVGFELAGLLARVRVDEGDTVKAAQVLAELDIERLEARRSGLKAQRDQAEADVTLARLTRQRVSEAQDLDAVSSQALDEAELGLQAKEAGLLQAQAFLDQVDVELAKSRLFAPFDAIVAGRFVDEGQVLPAGSAVLHLLERTQPEARVGVAGDAISSLAAGQSHTLEIDGQAVSATVRAVLPVRARGTRAVEVLLSLNASLAGAAASQPVPGALGSVSAENLVTPKVRSGDLARLSISRHLEQAGFWLPTSALTESSRGLWAVFVAEGDEATTLTSRRELEVLHEESDRVFVRGTLGNGERVIVSGLHRLVPGQRVQVTEPGGKSSSLTSRSTP